LIEVEPAVEAIKGFAGRAEERAAPGTKELGASS